MMTELSPVVELLLSTGTDDALSLLTTLVVAVADVVNMAVVAVAMEVLSVARMVVLAAVVGTLVGIEEVLSTVVGAPVCIEVLSACCCHSS